MQKIDTIDMAGINSPEIPIISTGGGGGGLYIETFAAISQVHYFCLESFIFEVYVYLKGK